MSTKKTKRAPEYRAIGDKIYLTLVGDNTPECEKMFDYLLDIARAFGAGDGGTCKTENKPTEEPKTDKGMFIPESENEAETDDFVGRSLTEIAAKVNQLDNDFDKVLGNIKRQLSNQDKRLWFVERKVEAVDRRVWK